MGWGGDGIEPSSLIEVYTYVLDVNDCLSREQASDNDVVLSLMNCIYVSTN